MEEIKIKMNRQERLSREEALELNLLSCSKVLELIYGYTWKTSRLYPESSHRAHYITLEPGSVTWPMQSFQCVAVENV